MKVCPSFAGLRVPEFQIKRCRHSIAIWRLGGRQSVAGPDLTGEMPPT